jgi:hypothetical protein
MKVAIMQPYFFPYIGYFQLIAAVDKFVIYDDVNFINRGWINRNNILINGKAALINVPLVGASQNKLIKDIELVADQKWRITLLRTIEHNYKKAPLFYQVYDILQRVINIEAFSISDFNFKCIKAVCEYMEITTDIVPSSEIYLNSDLKGQYRIMDICMKENSDDYINPIGGIELYDRKLFYDNKIKLSFIKSSEISYPQFKHDFTANLSILDTLMFCDTQLINKEFINAYDLV